MSKQPRVIRDRASTLRNTPAVSPTQSEQGLIIIVNGVVSTHALPAAGVVALGRARESDIQIIDPSVSRLHARLHLGPTVVIEDMGSANGTRVRGELLIAGPARRAAGRRVDRARQRDHHAAAAPDGDARVAHLGARLLRGPARGRVRARRAHATRRSHCVRLKAGEDTRSELVQQVLANDLRADDVVGIYGPATTRRCWSSAPKTKPQRVVGEPRTPPSPTSVSNAAIAIALFPNDGRTADRLVAKAGSALRGESADRRAGRPGRALAADARACTSWSSGSRRATSAC